MTNPCPGRNSLLTRDLYRKKLASKPGVKRAPAMAATAARHPRSKKPNLGNQSLEKKPFLFGSPKILS
jgi:hypothetical protein